MLVPFLALLWCLPLVRCQFSGGQSCFCKLSETVDECDCSVDSVDVFNNQDLFPLLQSLLQKDFFRYYKVNMERTCPFWADDGECGSQECGIKHCDDEVPIGLKKLKSTFDMSKTQCQLPDSCDDSNQFDPLDRHLSLATEVQLDAMDLHDENENKFCDIDG